MEDDVTRPGPSRIRRTYRLLLRLLPFEFRAEFGRDMEQAFSDELEDVRAHRSPVETLRFWLRTLKDFARTVPREQWDVLRQDVRVGVRLLKRNPGLTATAVLTLALGIGGSTSVFSLVHAVVLRPLTFPESKRVVRIGWSNPENPAILRPLSYADFQSLSTHRSTFDEVGASRQHYLSYEGEPLRVPDGSPGIFGVGPSFVPSMMASASYFRLFGASTVLGRLPDETDEQPGAPPVAVLSYSNWTSLFGRDPDVIGRTLVRSLTGGRQQPVTIVGVLTPRALVSAGSPSMDMETPAWASLDADAARESSRLSVHARLAPGVSIDAARTALAALTPRLAVDLPSTDAFAEASLQARFLRDEVVVGEHVRAPLIAFLWAVCCLLLLASVNVASLVLARTVSRRQELAVRFALGARPFRIARQLFTESAILAVAGGVLGLAVAWACHLAFLASNPPMPMPTLHESGIGLPALVFALGSVLLATGFAGLVPALQSSRHNVADGLRRAGGAPAAATGFSRPLATLAAAQVALVFVLLAGTGLLVNSFARLVLFDLGIEPRSVVTFAVTHLGETPSPQTATREGGQQTVATLSDRQRLRSTIDDELIQRVSATAGVAAAGLTGDDPFGPPYSYGRSMKIGRSQLEASADLRIANPTAFDALGMRLLGGRWLTERDRDGTELVAVVNDTMARRFWSGRSPIGDTMILDSRVLRVVGVVTDVYEGGARYDPRPAFYVSSTQTSMRADALLLVRVSPGAKGIDERIAAELALMGGRIKAGGPRRLADLWWWRLRDARFLTQVMSVFTLLALVVALVGVHGVLRFSVVQRTREMGIRKALGATPFDLISLVVGQALRFTLAGCTVGLVAALAAGPAIRSLLFGVSATDPLTLITVTLLLIAAVVVAAWFPARRASAVDPALSLRCE
jgi:putative ABC transport system permease protein